MDAQKQLSIDVARAVENDDANGVEKLLQLDEDKRVYYVLYAIYIKSKQFVQKAVAERAVKLGSPRYIEAALTSGDEDVFSLIVPEHEPTYDVQSIRIPYESLTPAMFVQFSMKMQMNSEQYLHMLVGAAVAGNVEVVNEALRYITKYDDLLYDLPLFEVHKMSHDINTVAKVRAVLKAQPVFAVDVCRSAIRAYNREAIFACLQCDLDKMEYLLMAEAFMYDCEEFVVAAAMAGVARMFTDFVAIDEENEHTRDVVASLTEDVDGRDIVNGVATDGWLVTAIKYGKDNFARGLINQGYPCEASDRCAAYLLAKHMQNREIMGYIRAKTAGRRLMSHRQERERRKRKYLSNGHVLEWIE